MDSGSRVRPRQMRLPFDDPPLWNFATLQASLLQEARRPLQLTLTENRSVLLSFRRRAGKVELRLHRMFLHAPAAVVRALGRGLRRTNRTANGAVRRFMNENLYRVRRGTTRVLPPRLTAGRVHDLQKVFDRLNARFFGGGLRVP